MLKQIIREHKKFEEVVRIKNAEIDQQQRKLEQQNLDIENLKKQLSTLEQILQDKENEIKNLQIKHHDQKQQITSLEREKQTLNSNYDRLYEKSKHVIDDILLEYAAIDDISKVKAALKLNADVNAKNEEGFNAFEISLMNDSRDVIFHLLPDLNLENLKTICKHGSPDVIKEVLKLTPKWDKNATLLLSLYDETDKAVAKKLIADSVLLTAAKQGNQELVDKALQRNADINVQDENNESALHKASYANKKEIVEYLIQKGAALNLLDKNQQTPAEVTSDKELKNWFKDHITKTEGAKKIQSAFRSYFYEKLEKEAAKKLFTFVKDDNRDGLEQLKKAIKEKNIKEMSKLIRDENVVDKNNAAENSITFKK